MKPKALTYDDLVHIHENLGIPLIVSNRNVIPGGR